MAELHHSIKVAAQRSGLSPHVIRVWERRYGAVEPHRTGTNRRAYSDADIERLSLLQRATHSGHTIGNVAKASTAKLRELLRGFEPAGPPQRSQGAASRDDLHAAAVQALRDLNTQTLEEVLSQGLMNLGNQGLLQKLVVPLAHEIGELWRKGEITAAHEHFASAVIRIFLFSAGRPFALEASAPNLVVATPSGQLHELGAVIVAAAASSCGWNVTYLGVGLPAAEIAGAAVQNRSRAVALSIVYPEDDAELPRELAELRRFLPAGIPIIAGGRAAKAYRKVLHQIGARQLDKLDELYPVLDGLRSGSFGRPG